MKEILQFSGGIDSLATLWVLKQRWPSLTLMWIDSGAAYPETRELVERLALELPLEHTVIVESHQPEWIATYGYPTDLLPIRRSHVGAAVHSFKGVKFSSWIDCCGQNLWIPAMRAAKELGATTIYRGQRNSDHKKAPMRSGHIEEGVKYIFPIAEWSRQRVRDFAAREFPEYLPAYYLDGEDSSRDCWDCTAYLEDNAKRISHLTPAQRAVVHGRLKELLAASATEERNIYNALEATLH